MKTFITYLSLSCLLLVGLSSCSEDTIDENGEGTLTGVVVEDGTNAPLENVKISTSPLSSTVFSDENGEFIIEDIATGDYSVQASLDGFVIEFEGATITDGNTTNVIFELGTEVANNRPPSSITLLTPDDKATDLESPIEFTWEAFDDDADDILTYTLSLRNDQNDDEIIIDDLSEPTYISENLMPNTQYFWQVAVNDGVNTENVNSVIRSFTTPDQAVGQGVRFLFVRQIDGNNVILSSDGDDNDTTTDVSSEIQLTSMTENSWRPRRNNEANRIAFLRTVGSQTHIFTMNFGGGNVTRVTGSIPVAGFNLDVVDFTWEAGGNAILFPNFDKLYRIGINGGAATLVYTTTDGSFITDVKASDFDDTIVLKTNNVNGYNARVFTINTAGTELQTIFSGMPGAVGGIDITADGTQVLYTYDTSGFENAATYRQLDTRLFIYTLATATILDISTNKVSGTNDLDARFSPSDAQVIFVNTSNDGISPGNITTKFISNTSTNDRETIINDGIMPDWE